MMLLHLFRPRSCCRAGWRPLVVVAERLRSAAALASRWSDIDFEARCDHGEPLWVHYTFRSQVALHSALRGYARRVFATEDCVESYETGRSFAPLSLRREQ